MNRHAFPLAITATLAALVLAACGDDTEPTSADDPASTPASETTDAAGTDATTTTTASEEPSESDTGGTTQTQPVPVFFVGDTPQGPRLFSEVREVPSDNPLEEAAALMTAGDAVDPDYRTLYPGGTFASVEDSGDRFVVTVADDGWSTRAPGMSNAEAKLAVQQLVYTLQAVAGEEKPVSIEPTGALFGVDGAQVAAADPVSVRGLVNVLSPAEGEAVSGSFTASGEASSFEATVPWEIRDQSGAKVLDGFSTAEGWIDDLYPWQAEVDVSSLDAGTYTFVAMTDDPSGGEGPGPTEDTKTIVVE